MCELDDYNESGKLIELSWLESALNILFIGSERWEDPPGSITEDCRCECRVQNCIHAHGAACTYIPNAGDIVKSKQKLKKLMQADLVIIDEIGFQPVTRQEANMLFGVVNQLYQQTSIILTSNKGVAEWGEFMGGPVITTAMLDMLMHKCEIFDMDDDSYGLAHKERILK